MDLRVRRKLAMVSRVRQFCRSNPSDIEGYTECVALLEEQLAHAESLAAQEVTGFLTERASTTRKSVLRSTIREKHLRHLVRMARGSVRLDASLPTRCRLPLKGINGQEFLAAARTIAGQAVPYRELFIKDGMPATFLGDLDEMLEQYARAVSGQHNGSMLHIGARAALKAITTELLILVKRLDGINLRRFEEDGEKRGAWLAARDVAWPGVGATTARVSGEKTELGSRSYKLCHPPTA